jgi:signal transduction histidine kinase/ActR/RegA family two-component response regulator
VTRIFRHLPIRLKLMAIIMTTCAASVVLASLGYLLIDYYQTREELGRDLQAQADLILQNSFAALDFDDTRAARDTLNTLSSKTNIRIACLYQRDGRLFTAYQLNEDAGACPSQPPPQGMRFGSESVQLVRVGYDTGKKFGSLMLRSDLAVLARRGQAQLLIVGVLLVFALGLAVLLSTRLQAIVSDPVIALATTAREVTRRDDYALRATRSTDDELGELVDAFNRMLERIEAREMDLSRANDDLRREIAERRRAEQERAELLVREREANRLKDEFLATLSHELRTPLNAILGWTKLLRANAVPSASIDRALEKVERNAQVQSRLIEDLLEISRIVSGKLRLDYRAFDLIALCNTAVESIRPAAENRGVTIEREFERTSLPTSGDPDRLQQVIWNLLSNAVKFTPAGGRVTIAVRRAGDRDEIVVRDTGIGIDPAFLPNVFESFRQADASTTRAHGGLGLGLAIVKQLVALHGGEVIASSEGKDRGATFTVRLPVRSVERRADEMSAATLDALKDMLAGRDILVLDDDVDTRELLVTTLEGAGAQVRSAASSPEALALIRQRVPEAVVSDIGMPGEDGYTFMRTLTQDFGEHVPRARVALSAFAAPGDREHALAVGFQRHVAKPVDPEEVIRTLAGLLEQPASRV